MRHSRWRRIRSRRGISDIIAAVFLVAITITAGALLWMLRFPLNHPPPTLWYNAQGGKTVPVWGDPTDCSPRMPHSTSYYLGNGSRDSRYSTYMNAWWNQCEFSQTGVYQQMNISEILFTQVSQPILLSDVQFSFVCHNSTPRPMTTYLVRGSLQAMSWFPGSSQVLPSTAPKLWSCGTFNASGYGGGAFSTFYNRLGYFQPIAPNATLLVPGDAFILYVHSYDSVLEAPSPIEPSSTWGHNDFDDYHGAPAWCFNNPGACEIQMTDTATTPNVLLADIQISLLST